VTTLGRSEECEVTIEDPLVSRRHAQISVDGDEVRLVDLGSRNGVRINGRPVQGSVVLQDGDRVRIGTQVLVFSCILAREGRSQTRATGALRLCARCKLPFARETTACPHCGASEQTDEETFSGIFGQESQRSWSVQLLLEAIDRALAQERVSDADRLLQRATAMFEERLADGCKLEPEQVARAAIAAALICEATKDASWGRWIPSFYGRVVMQPPASVSDRLGQLVVIHPELRQLVVDMLRVVPTRDLGAADAAALTRLCDRGS
jgi:hypothetical protein